MPEVLGPKRDRSLAPLLPSAPSLRSFPPLPSLAHSLPRTLPPSLPPSPPHTLRSQLPISHPCPGAAHPANESHANGNSLGGPIAVWCPLDTLPDENFYDSNLADDTIARLRHGAGVFNATGKPFFVMSGFARPHTPWRVPQRFWDLYTTEDIRLAEHKLPPKDMPGVAWMAHSFWNTSTGEVWQTNVTSPLDDDVARLARHAYYASVSWLDHQVGRILSELEALGMAENTIVTLNGDHGWQLGEHNSWHKYTNFELGTRVPLIVRAPMYPSAMGRVTSGLAELVDLFPTISELAGAPTTGNALPGERLDGVSLVPFFEDPEREGFPTSIDQGTRNKTLAFSQYPHSDHGASTPATECPFFENGACRATPGAEAGAVRGGVTAEAVEAAEAAEASAPKPKAKQWMGFSVRDAQWRYTTWVPFNGTRADWGAAEKARPAIHELYNHSYNPLTTTSMDDVDDVANLAYALPEMAAAYFALARDFFEVIAPPTAPAGGVVPPARACESWCTKGKFTPKQYCKFVACEVCPKCVGSEYV